MSLHWFSSSHRPKTCMNCLSVATNLRFGWVWMVVCFWYTLKCGLKHHWGNSEGKSPLTFSWHLSRSKAAMAKKFAAGGKMKNKAEKESEVTAATKPHSSSGLKNKLQFKGIVEIQILPSRRLIEGQLQSSMRCSKTFLTSTKKPCLFSRKSKSK